MEKSTAVERISGNFLAKAGLTIIAAAAASPLAAFLPLLAESLAGRRHSARIEKALEDIQRLLKEHETQIEKLTDPQYKLLNEAVIAIMQNTEDAMCFPLSLESCGSSSRVPPNLPACPGWEN